MKGSLRFLTPGCLALLATGCGQDDRILVPNRVLDRPLDVVLACVQDSGSRIEVLSLNQCEGSNTGNCNSSSPTPQLIGFVTNSERNELAMFRKCDKDSALVDMDPDAPGYNLIPAGRLPSALTITEDSCRTVSANTGSCDMTVLDVAGLGAYAINTTREGTEPPELPSPSTLITTVEPRNGDGQRLAASPARLLAVPRALSLAGESAPDPVDGGEDGDDGDGGPVGEVPEGTVCDLSRAASVYMTFPSCQLVAEVSLTNGTVLQARQFVTTDAGEVELVDPGPDVRCPVDCPAQFDGDLPEESPLVDPNGVFPTSLEFVPSNASGGATDPGVGGVDEGGALVLPHALFVGGPGSDLLWQIPIDDDGRFADEALSLQLEDPQGVEGIRATPRAEVLGDVHQFLYVIAGDGSTRVVDRDLDDEQTFGTECDTQIDPTLEAPTACHPINPGQASNALDRRPLAVGPGIRPLGRVTINDWSFHLLTQEEADQFCGTGGENESTLDIDRTPFCTPTLVGVGVTSIGTVLYSSFGQFSERETISTAIDPIGVMNVQVRPHSLWPAIDPFAANPLREALPLVADEEPGRALPGGGSDAQTLSPSLRRIDLAYSADAISGDISSEQEAVAAALGNPANADRLGDFDGEGLYENDAPRVAVRDFQQWGAQTWTLAWESTIPGTASTTGLVQCDNHGTIEGGNQVPGGTCRNSEPDDARLEDESANFCEDGVLAGDTLVLLGCSDDDSCGVGQKCLREPTAPSTTTGICVSELAYAEERAELRDVCAPFIGNACGSAPREYRITRAFDDELWLQALDRPLRSVVRDMAGEGEPVDLREYAARLSCEAPVQRVEALETCTSDAECLPDPYAADNQRDAMVCDTSREVSRCVGDQPEGGCGDDDDCLGLGAQYVCVDSLCRAPCDLCPPPAQPDQPCRADDECVGEGEVCVVGTCHQRCEQDNPACMRSPLPGPRCFPELVRYNVELHDSFSFTGSSIPFLTDRVIPDATTGECVEDPAVSSLLTSRIRLGATEADTFGTGPWQIPDCVNPTEAGPDDPNPCRIVTDRQTSPLSRFHTFRYRDEPVAAIRYSNPVLTVVIDLVSLTGLTSEPPDAPDQNWPAEFADFLRARIPDGYREEFASANGFVPFNEAVSVASLLPLVYPVRIVSAPEPNVNFIVDAGGRGGVQGVRGQVVRIEHNPGQVITDNTFLVR